MLSPDQILKLYNDKEKFSALSPPQHHKIMGQLWRFQFNEKEIWGALSCEQQRAIEGYDLAHDFQHNMKHGICLRGYEKQWKAQVNACKN